jgi:hypothetical protein
VKVFPNKVYFEVKIENIFELRENRIKINIEKKNGERIEQKIGLYDDILFCLSLSITAVFIFFFSLSFSTTCKYSLTDVLDQYC